MPDTRSALASCAARRASSGTASTEPAIWNASSAMRSTRSFCVPSFSWKVMPASALAISSSGFFRSCCQKNLASASRARITFSLPATISLPPSLGAKVGHQQEAVGELARARSFEREALLVLLHGQHQAFRRHLQERLVEAAHQHQRPFREPGVLGQQRLVLDQRQLVLLGQRARLLADQRRPLGRIEDDLVRLEALGVVGRALHLERLVAVEAMPARRRCRSRRPRCRAAPPCRRAGR